MKQPTEQVLVYSMPAWDEVMDEIAREEGKKLAISPLDAVRGKYIKKLSKYRNRNVICYYSGWLQRISPGENLPTLSIVDDDMNGFMNVIHEMDRDKGLDLILHTPGGSISATEAIVKYLKKCFDNDIVAIVPQLSMSAGTMIACSCKEIYMGKQSSLGPTDPQLGGLAASAVLEEFDSAIQQIEEKPASSVLWAQIIGKYSPTFLGECQRALDVSVGMVNTWLSENMLNDGGDADLVAKSLCDHNGSAMHDRHFSIDDARRIGLKITDLEDDNKLQDLVLTIHHAYMHTFSRSTCIKIIESADKRWINAAANS